MSVGRFAPSPSGSLHVGNLRTALAAWLFARAAGSSFHLRFEDLDAATSKRIHEDGQRRDLERLGLEWDGEPLRQSEHVDRYHAVIERLAEAGLTYPCWCSRREIREAATAPHVPHGQYPGTCRDLSERARAERQGGGRPPALRLRSGGAAVEIVDRLHGPVRSVVDDFVLRRGDGTPAYNLVVVVDDDLQGVEEVVRADDLLSSTPRHAHLGRSLGLASPGWAHVPLVMGADGERLAKRHGAVTLADRLAVGDSPERVLAVLASSLGLAVAEREIAASDLIDRFDVGSLRLDPWVLDEQQENGAW